MAPGGRRPSRSRHSEYRPCEPGPGPSWEERSQLMAGARATARRLGWPAGLQDRGPRLNLVPAWRRPLRTTADPAPLGTTPVPLPEVRSVPERFPARGTGRQRKSTSLKLPGAAPPASALILPAALPPSSWDARPGSPASTGTVFWYVEGTLATSSKVEAFYKTGQRSEGRTRAPPP